MVISVEVQNAILNAAGAVVNGGSLLLREGSTTRVTLPLKATAFLAAASGSMSLDVSTPTMSASAASSATSALDGYQIVTSGSAVRFSGTVGAVGSGMEIEMNHTDVKVGDSVTMSAYALAMPTGP